MRVRCASCGRRLARSDPRTIANGLPDGRGDYVCADCTYLRDNGVTSPFPRALHEARTKLAAERPPQAETLFDPDAL